MFETDVAMQLKETHTRLAQLMQQKINKYNLRIGLLHLAMLVKKYPDKSQKDLAKEMRFTEGAMSHSVKRLIQENILEQIPLQTDMRYNRLVVTKKGENFIKDYESYILKVYKDIFIGFKDDELNELDKYLKRINSNLEKISNEEIENI
ncbi:MarR family winged helix-turn-helix transcriptional regulator [Tissierella sp.]|uniref:MarR family winged helix-turn-helix transcriptional regulator n=1 Tax=Tissierella sp. TaxID=41274 RepID=UPI002858ED05|nr:MarR family winged helix-turn-helix transcriptional regulator [Tissierella sp.]MDR7856870.1 MarR family winged helix-turn-helix transcriptional regulator [Tissierella sp.]